MSEFYSVDGQKTVYTKMVSMAEDCGYKTSSGIYLTSEAARILRQYGHIIEEWNESKTPEAR